jgi:hypothetical protein
MVRREVAGEVEVILLDWKRREGAVRWARREVRLCPPYGSGYRLHPTIKNLGGEDCRWIDVNF